MFLSKSKYLIGLQCSKALWINYNDKALIPETDEATQAIFDQGHEVGALAKQLFPGGIDLNNVTGIDAALAATPDALKQGKPVFEAALSHNSCLSRADILNPVKCGKWDLIEVKSATQQKDVNLEDIAFQRYVYEGAGLKIRKCYLMLINNQYVRNGEIDPGQLFSKIDVTEGIDGLLPSVPGKTKEMLDVIALKKCPDVKIGPHCSDPYACALIPVCWAEVPSPGVFNLRYGGKKTWALYDDGIQTLEDIPYDFPLNNQQTIQVECQKTGKPHVDPDALRRFLDQIKYPLYSLDFETIGTAIPLFNQCRPYQQIPFQFSLHVIKRKGDPAQHFGFLAEGRDDPRPALLKWLQPVLGRSGTILTYNKSFEIGRLNECADSFPEFTEWVESLIPRIVDLLDPFRAMDYYHPAQNGSASLKAVYPALTGKSYEGLEIQEGDTASREFLRITFGDVSEAEKQEVRKALETYCCQDTQAPIDLLAAIEEICAAKS